MLLWPLGHATAEEGTQRLGVSAPAGEELPHDGPALFGQDTAYDLGSMREPAIAQKVPRRPRSAVLVVPGPEDHPIHARQLCGPRAHGARLERHDQGAADEVSVTECECSLAEHHDLGVGGGIGERLATIGRLGKHGAIGPEHQRSDRDVLITGEQRLPGQFECLAHRGGVGLGVPHASVALERRRELVIEAETCRDGHDLLVGIELGIVEDQLELAHGHTHVGCEGEVSDRLDLVEFLVILG